MARFEARILTRGGVKISAVIANDLAEAKKLAARQGKVMSVKRKWGWDIVPGMSVSERYMFLVRMSNLIGSRVGTGEALKLMATHFGGNIRKTSRAMLSRVEAGMTLPEAMEQDRKSFPATTTALIKAGVSSGETWKALKDTADFEYKMSNVHKGSMKQIYGAIGSFLTAGALMIATTQYFGPQVMDNKMFKDAKGVDVEWARTLGDVSTGIMITLLVIFGFFYWLGTIGRQIMPDMADKFIMKIPYYKDLILARNNHVTLYKLGLLITSGVRLEEALLLSERSSPRGALKADLGRALKAVRAGQPPWGTMDTLHETDKAALSTSTNRDEIARTLNMLAEQYSDLYIQRISTFAPALGMIAAIFMTLAGAILFAQTILPMLQLSANVS